MPEYGINGTTLNLSAIQLKFKLANEWAANDALLAGEIGIEKDTHKFKVGDGVTSWGELPYSADPNIQTLVDGLTQRITTAEGTVTSHGQRLDTAESTITAHGTRLTTAENAITAAEGRISTAEADIDAAEDRLDTAEADIDALEGRMTTAEADIDAVEGRATALETKDTQHESRMTAIEGVNTSQATEISGLGTRVSTLEGVTILSANPFRQ